MDKLHFAVLVATTVAFALVPASVAVAVVQAEINGCLYIAEALFSASLRKS